MISIVTPAYNEKDNLLPLYGRINKVFAEIKQEWEWMIIDDHSSDGTFDVVKEIAVQDTRVRGLRLSRNFGSHNAYLCGITNSKGEAVVAMAGDGQDPPELIVELFDKWKDGHQVVWAGRNPTKNNDVISRFFSRAYYMIMRKFVGMQNMPERGADFFLADRIVCDALLNCQERNMSIFAMITWMGFRQELIHYDQQIRVHGKTGWTLSKKIKLLIDSIIGFSYLPIRAMGTIGAVVALIGLLYIPFIVINAILGHPVEGWSSLTIIVIILGGVQMLMLSVLGEYLWRTLEESRNRPNFLIEEATQPLESYSETDHV
jgi:dolichol-phosphate mannosyltransferase